MTMYLKIIFDCVKCVFKTLNYLLESIENLNEKVTEKNEKNLLRPKRKRKLMDITHYENPHCDVESQKKK